MKTSEKRLVFAAGGSIALLLGAGLWWSHLNAAFVADRPPVKMPEPNAFDFYVKAGQMLAAAKAATPGNAAVDRVTDGRFDPKWSEQEIARRYPTAGKIQWLKKCAPALQTLRQGFAHEYREPPRTYPNLVFGPYGKFRELARLLCIESHSRAEQGDWAGASRSTLDILEMGHDVPRGGPLIAALVGYAINAIGCKELQAILPNLDARSARAAAARIELLESRRVGYAETLEEEKWVGQLELQMLMKTMGWRIGLLVMRRKEVSARQVFRLMLQSKRGAARDHARYMDALAAEARKPSKAWQSPNLPIDPLNDALIPVYGRSRWNAARAESKSLQLMLQLALHAFRLERGRHPDSLQELAPAYIKRVPHDPFGGGEAMRYKRTGESYLLYSIGPDGKDDGGKPVDRPLKNRPNSENRYLLQPDSIGDFVSGINR